MLITRLVFSIVVAVLSLGLGIFALATAPRQRLNRAFATFAFANAFWNLGGFALFFLDYQIGILIYRLCQVCALVVLFGEVVFVQEILGIYDRRGPTIVRNVIAALAVVSVPLSLMGAGIQKYTLAVGNEAVFTRQAGPFHLVILVGFIAAAIALAALVLKRLKDFEGAKRNQLIYVALAMGMHVLTLIFYLLSYLVADWPWTYFSFQIAEIICFSFAIFKHQMFGFRAWIAERVIFAGVYAAIIAVPFVVLPIRDWTLGHMTSMAWVFPSTLIAYGILFALAPFIAHQIQLHTEKKLIEKTRELEDLDRLKTDFISDVTHEFKSPVAIVESVVDALLKDAQNGPVQKKKLIDYLKMIRHNSERLNLFIQNLLQVAKIRESKITLSMKRDSLSDIVKDAARFIRPLAKEKGLKLQLDVPAALHATVDREKLSLVFCNLFSNAVKFTEKGSVSATAERSGGIVRLVVKDTGIGIDPAYTSKVFDRFFQSPDTEKLGRGKGTGLGLTIAKAWVEAHHGRVWAQSEGLGKGSSFIVELPEKAA